MSRWRRWLEFLFIGSLAGWIVFTASRAVLRVTNGLQGEYFETIGPTDSPVLTVVDEDISTDQVTRNWLGSAPSVFFVRWTGYLTVGENDVYTFSLASDDGSILALDGQTLIDNGGRHSEVMRSGQRRLDPGAHLFVLEYFQGGGPYSISLSWARGSGHADSIPAWRLSPGKHLLWKTTTARALDLLALAAAILCGTLVLGFAVTWWRPAIVHGLWSRPKLAALLLFTILSALETWPLITDPARLSRNDNSDTVLNEWAMAWVVHQAPRAPLHLFDGNIFYPDHDTLAYSEPLIVQSAFAAPILWLGGSPVLAYNLVMLAGFALTGWTMSLVVTRWTGDWIAGLLSGILFAFNAHTLTRLPHMQAQHVEFLPLALLALDALLRAPGVRHALWLALWFALQALTSVYLLVFTAVALTVAAIVRPEDWAGRRFVRVASFIGLAAGIAGAGLFPFLMPYWRLWHREGYSRSIDDAVGFAALWRDYLTTPGRVHFALWSHSWFSGNALFPGVLGATLAAVAIARGLASTDRRARMCLAFGVAGMILSFGGTVPGYALLHRAIPLLQAIRVTSRFGYLEIVAVAVLAGFGAASIRRALTGRRRLAFSMAALALAVIEPLAAPLELTRFMGISPIYSRLATDQPAVVVEIPFYPPNLAFVNAKYMLSSTRHWKPLVNGYSGFQSRHYYEHFEAFSGFPSPKSIAALQITGVTHVFVHTNEVDPATLEQLTHVSALHRMASDGSVVLYALDPG